MKILNVSIPNQNSYDILIEDGILNHLSFHIKKVYNSKNVFIITDDNVSSYYLDKVTKELEKEYIVKSVIIKAGEESKTLETYAYIAQKLIDLDIRRNNLIIGLGGGVIGDLSGFVASTIFRGNPYINIPTTLLSQMDSSIGGKTGIDFYNRKNILGVFAQPKLVIIDPLTLNTLPQGEIQSGMGELIKHAFIGNKDLIVELQKCPTINEDIIAESLKVKKRVVELDPFDQKERMTLNFGHTFGHAIELKLNLKHGIAVSNGMLMAIKMGIDLGITKASTYDMLEDILRKYNIPYSQIDYKDYINDVRYDKKNLAGTINFILVTNPGECIIHKIEEKELEKLVV